MGIFSNKTDDNQSSDSNANVASDSSVVSQVTDTVISPTPTAPPLSTVPDEDNGGYLTDNEPTTVSGQEPAIPSVESSTTDASTSVPTPGSVSPSGPIQQQTDNAIDSNNASDVTSNIPNTGSIEANQPDVSTSIATPITVTDTGQSSSQGATTTSTDSEDDGLADIKKEAISKLSPLVSLLDQTPEEKFHTTMMLLQSTDDKSLIKDAYEAAQSITDEKIKAQALLDVVNEINYYTQQDQQIEAV